MLKQDSKTLWLVHDLQPLNAVTIQDSSVPPFIEHLAESFSRYAVYGMMDLFTRYDQCPLHVDSRDTVTPKSVTITNLAPRNHPWESHFTLVEPNRVQTPGYKSVPGSCDPAQRSLRYDSFKTAIPL